MIFLQLLIFNILFVITAEDFKLVKTQPEIEEDESFWLVDDDDVDVSDLIFFINI